MIILLRMLEEVVERQRQCYALAVERAGQE